MHARSFALGALAIALSLATANSAAAQAQQLPYRQDFEGAAAGWQLNGLWAVDGSPASVPGGAAASGSRSLNFNNGVDYAGTHRATCSSPALVGYPGQEHVLRFRCNYRTETTGTRYDKRSVVVHASGLTMYDAVLSSLSSAPAGARCGAMGTWHTHEIRLPATNHVRALFFSVELTFDTVDAIANNHPGWFVDDVSFEVIGIAPQAPPFDVLTRRTNDFRDLTTGTTIQLDGTVQIARSSPTARYALVTGTATPSERQALEQAILNANLASIPATIPDPNTYIVRPTVFTLEVTSQVAANHNTIDGSVGVYGAWQAQLGPVMGAIEAIQARLLDNQSGGGAGDDHGNDAQSATSIGIDPNAAATAGAIDPAGDVDWFQIVDYTPMIAIFPPPQRTYIIETTVGSGMDTVLDVFAADGATLLASNDDAPGMGLASRVTLTLAQGTVMYARVRHYGATKTGTYTIRATAQGVVAPQPGTPDDHGDTPASATALSVNAAPIGGIIDAAGDQDWFTVQLMSIAIFPPPQYQFVFQTAVIGNADTVLEVFAADGTTLLGSNDDAPGLGLASKVVVNGPASTYYVKVRHYSATGTGSYTVQATQSPLAP